ncbi:MAG: hypothetical protein ACSHWW_08280 [Nonlabens sp.]
MKSPVKSLFNLIEIFRKGFHRTQPILVPKEHCESLSLHDYYCDQEHLGV